MTISNSQSNPRSLFVEPSQRFLDAAHRWAARSGRGRISCWCCSTEHRKRSANHGRERPQGRWRLAVNHNVVPPHCYLRDAQAETAREASCYQWIGLRFTWGCRVLNAWSQLILGWHKQRRIGLRTSVMDSTMLQRDIGPVPSLLSIWDRSDRLWGFLAVARN